MGLEIIVIETQYNYFLEPCAQKQLGIAQEEGVCREQSGKIVHFQPNMLEVGAILDKS